MTHARTLPRYVGAAGFVAGLLVAFPSLSYANWQAQITDVQPTGQSTSTHIQTRVSSNYRFSANDPRFYNRSLSLVSRQTVRTGALAALSRGVMHPGLAIAITAAGFFYANGSVYDELPSSYLDNPDLADMHYPYLDNGLSYRINSNQPGYAYGPWADTPLAAAVYGTSSNYHYTDHDWVINSLHASRVWFEHPEFGTSRTTTLTITSSLNITPNPYPENHFDRYSDPLTESELSALDQHLPDVLVREIYQADTYPEPWYESLDVSTLPLSQVSSPNGQAAPEIFEDIARAAENQTAKINGDPEPHTTTITNTNTAQDEMLDRWDEPVPDFSQVEPQWNVETIDQLPSYDIGLGSGQCPAPSVIQIPSPFNSTIELNWQPICDFASMIRGVVIAVSMILSLYIVLRRS